LTLVLNKIKSEPWKAIESFGKKIRHTIEYGLARVLLLLFDHLPYSITRSLARGAANLWWWVDIRRQKVAVKNILRSGVETDPKRARAIAKKSIQTFSILVLESLKSSTILEDDTWKDHVTLKIPPDVMQALQDPDKGLILAAGHLGNWEIAAHLVSQFKPVAGITRPMNNPLIEQLIQSRKGRYRFRPIPKRESKPSRLIEVLDNKEILALLFDQHAGEQGVMIDFFGHPASTHKTIAMMHLVTRTPICYAECLSTGPMRFEISTSPLIQQAPTGNKNEDVHSILLQLNQHLETSIRKAPEQYLWAHRRWRD